MKRGVKKKQSGVSKGISYAFERTKTTAEISEISFNNLFTEIIIKSYVK